MTYPALTAWCHAIRTGPDNALRRFVINPDTDRDAAHNALTHPHGNASTDGQVTHLMRLERSSYGPAIFALPRKEILHQFA